MRDDHYKDYSKAIRRGRDVRGFLFITYLVSLSLLWSSPGVAVTEADSIKHHAYYALIESKKCKANGVQSITCTYSVEDHLAFSIEGIGELDAAVTFDFVSPISAYYARFGSRPGCVLIQRKSSETIDPIQAMSDLAYVSLRNGKVYNNWPDCKEGQ